MKEGIHPESKVVKVTCSCSNTFNTRSTLCHDLHVDVCAKCHPFYTGKQKVIDSEGRVERFHQKYVRKPLVAKAQQNAEQQKSK